jgi:hypothetical protein
LSEACGICERLFLFFVRGVAGTSVDSSKLCHADPEAASAKPRHGKRCCIESAHGESGKAEQFPAAPHNDDRLG